MKGIYAEKPHLSRIQHLIRAPTHRPVPSLDTNLNQAQHHRTRRHKAGGPLNPGSRGTSLVHLQTVSNEENKPRLGETYRDLEITTAGLRGVALAGQVALAVSDLLGEAGDGLGAPAFPVWGVSWLIPS